MPQEIADIKRFIEICRRKDASCKQARHHLYPVHKSVRSLSLAIANMLCPAARIKRNKKTNQIKFKVRCSRYLYSLSLKDADKADKLKQSLPPCTCTDAKWNCRVLGNGFANIFDLALQITDAPKKNKKGKRTA